MKVDINVPESLNEITLYQYQKFEKLIQNNEASHFVNQKTIEIFCDIELKDVARIKVADTDSLLVHLNTLLQTKPKLTRTFKLGVYEFGFIPKIEDITSGEFIDLDYYFKTGSIENLHLLCSILYKQYKIDEWNNTIEEPYIYDIHIRSEHFLKEPISNIYGIINYFYKFKENFINNYTGIFTSPDDDLDLEGLDQNEINEIKKEIEEDKKRSEFSWQLLVFDLTNGDLTKFESVCGLSLIYVFNTIAMKKAMKL